MSCPIMVLGPQNSGGPSIQTLQKLDQLEVMAGGLTGHLKDFSGLFIQSERNFPVQTEEKASRYGHHWFSAGLETFRLSGSGLTSRLDT